MCISIFEYKNESCKSWVFFLSKELSVNLFYALHHKHCLLFIAMDHSNVTCIFYSSSSPCSCVGRDELCSLCGVTLLLQQEEFKRESLCVSQWRRPSVIAVLFYTQKRMKSYDSSSTLLCVPVCVCASVWKPADCLLCVKETGLFEVCWSDPY